MKQRKPGSPYEWEDLSEEELLKIRICDLGLTIEGSELEETVAQLYGDLEARGLRLKPKTYLGDEWFSPEDVPSICIPFYLAHPRLKELEEKMMLEVEGGDADWCLKILRHEAGHCYDHAYRFSRRKRWRELFGSPYEEYAPEKYRPRPYSKSYVRNLDNWYAQAHPDEDFAETFAVLLDPERDWEAEYSYWPIALEKLRYVDQLMKRAAQEAPKTTSGPHPYSVKSLKISLEKYYARRKKDNAADYPDFYDEDLRRIFDGEPGLPAKDFSAARYLRQNRKVILNAVNYWTAEKKYTINGLIRQFADRCEELDLRIGKDEKRLNMEIAAYLASLVTNYLFTGFFKRTI